MDQPLFQQGVELMLFGMGTVVVFLALLVVAMRIMSALLARLAPEAPAGPALLMARDMAPAPGAVDEEHIAAIAAALHAHRTR